MGQEPTTALPVGLLELKEILEAEWPARRAALHASGLPLCEVDDDAKDDADDADKGDKSDDDAKDDDDDAEGRTYGAPYVKRLRDEAAKHRREAREAQARAKAYEDKDKSEAQKLEERATTAEQKATTTEHEVLRLRVALKKGLTDTQAKRLIGDTEEDLETDADELLASFKTNTDDDQGSSRRPRERLRPGAAPSAEAEETDPKKLAEQVPRMYQ